MRTLVCFLTLLILAGCAGSDFMPNGLGGRREPASLSALKQYKAAKEAFRKKLAEATGLSLSELQAKWGAVRQGITYNKSTVYNWVRTVYVVPPPEAAAKLDSDELPEVQDPDQPLALSCMAVFIVNQDKVVDEAFSEGRCLDHNLMPGWKPVVETSVVWPDFNN